MNIYWGEAFIIWQIVGCFFYTATDLWKNNKLFFKNPRPVLNLFIPLCGIGPTLLFLLFEIIIFVEWITNDYKLIPVIKDRKQ